MAIPVPADYHDHAYGFDADYFIPFPYIEDIHETDDWEFTDDLSQGGRDIAEQTRLLKIRLLQNAYPDPTQPEFSFAF